jgi:hypothetical protein
MHSINYYLEDYAHAAEAARAFQEDMAVEAASGNISAAINLTLLRNVHDVLLAYRQTPQFKSGWGHLNPGVFDCEPIIAESGGRLEVIRFNCGQVVLIDRNLFLSLILFTYFVGKSSQGDTYSLMATWLFINLTFQQSCKLDYLDELFLVALESERLTLSSIITSCSSFLIGHELGHLYEQVNGAQSIAEGIVFESDGFIGIDTQTETSIKLHEDGNLWSSYKNLDGKEVLLIPERYEHWKVEFVADIHAVYFKLLLEAEGKPNSHHLEKLMHHLTVWQMFLYALSFRQALRSQASETHPPPSARMDVLVWHVNQLAEDVDPEWRSPALWHLQQQYQRIWSKKNRELFEDLRLYINFTIDAHCQGRVGRNWESFVLNGAVPLNDGVLEKFARLVLEPIAHRSNTNSLLDIYFKRSGFRFFQKTVGISGSSKFAYSL